jgi:hypothetical protein
MKKIFVWMPIVLAMLTGCDRNAEQERYVDFGATGSCTWTLAGVPGNYTLTISGSGAMEDYVEQIIDGTLQTTAPWNAYREDITTVVIRGEVTAVGKYAFAGCTGLTNVIIGNSVTAIGAWAFYGCSGLTGTLRIPHSVITIGDGAFVVCHGLTGVTVGNSVTTIGKYAFYACAGLTDVTISNSVTTIDNFAFADCRKLTEINVNADNAKYSSADGVLFNKNKTELIVYPAGKTGNYAIPHSVTTITINAFSNCIGLTGVDIPHSVTTIGRETFSGCSGLSTVTNRRSTPQSIDSNVFANTGISSNGTLRVPDGAVEAYKAANGWKGFKNIVAL